MKYRLFVLLAVLSFPSMYLSAQKTGGGDLNPGLHASLESLEKFQDMRFGLSIHWGPSCIGGKEISWSRGEEIPKDTYDNFYKEFNPVNFSAKEWVDLAKDGGMKYISLTSKHHDGFSLWPTMYSDYDIASTPFNRDIVMELSNACRDEGLLFASYYSIIDWYHGDYQPYGHGGPGELSGKTEESPDFEKYITFMQNQLRELIETYGAEFIQFDGEWESTWNHELGSQLYAFIHSVDDKVLINSRVDVGRSHLDSDGKWDWKVYAGDFEERERMVDWVNHKSEVFGKSAVPWQAWVTIDQAQWSYNDTPRLLNADEIIVDLLKTIGDNGNYLINLGPRPDGTFHPGQIETVKEVGKWVKKYGDAIYGTRGGPFTLEGNYTSTKKGETIYLFVINDELKEIELLVEGIKIQGAEKYNGEDLKWRSKDDTVILSLEDFEDEPIRVVKIELK